ncbi:hypothetical protein, partial [Roseateles sp.]|uniref:hypothetical protein n=1 Tax=Roseateles sp. TaxID=1971397 RepID=UPI003BA69C4E
MAMKKWQESHPHLFKKKVINHPGPDTRANFHDVGQRPGSWKTSTLTASIDSGVANVRLIWCCRSIPHGRGMRKKSPAVFDGQGQS